MFKTLKATYLGHTAEQVAEASEMVLKHGFELGLQMMIGLPEDSFESIRKAA